MRLPHVNNKELRHRGITPHEIKMLRQSHLIEGLDENEELVGVIHRHPIGLVIIYLFTFIALLCGGALAVFLVPQVNVTDSSTSTLMVLILILFGTIALIGLIVATYVYNGNKLIITNKNVTQILMTSPFSRKVSELSMSNVEDVSALKGGILAHIFGYGTLRIQTAGELENFKFDFCPRPNYFGRIILDARQKYADSVAD